MRYMKRLSTIFVLIGVLALMAATTQANQVVTYKVTNNTGSAAGDLHVDFSGSGGTVATVVKVQPPLCIVDSYPGNPPTVGSEAVVVWTTDCVPPGGSVVIRVSTPNGPLTFQSGYWTDAAHPGVGGIGAVEAGDIEEVSTVPSITLVGAFALVLLLIASGVYIMRRRKATA